MFLPGNLRPESPSADTQWNQRASNTLLQKLQNGLSASVKFGRQSMGRVYDFQQVFRTQAGNKECQDFTVLSSVPRGTESLVHRVPLIFISSSQM